MAVAVAQSDVGPAGLEPADDATVDGEVGERLDWYTNGFGWRVAEGARVARGGRAFSLLLSVSVAGGAGARAEPAGASSFSQLRGEWLLPDEWRAIAGASTGLSW